jgi:hypothetical protein
MLASTSAARRANRAQPARGAHRAQRPARYAKTEQHHSQHQQLRVLCAKIAHKESFQVLVLTFVRIVARVRSLVLEQHHAHHATLDKKALIWHRTAPNAMPAPIPMSAFWHANSVMLAHSRQPVKATAPAAQPARGARLPQAHARRARTARGHHKLMHQQLTHVLLAKLEHSLKKVPSYASIARKDSNQHPVPLFVFIVKPTQKA